MKKILFGLAVLGLLAGMSTLASAAVQQGDTTLTFDVGYNYMELSDADVNVWDLTGRVAIGRFLTNNFQLEGILNGMTGELDFGDGTEDFSAGAVLIRPNFHFLTESTTVPYVGAAVGFCYYDIAGEDETNFMWGAQAGLKQFIRDNVFIQMEASYLRTEIMDEDLDNFRIMAGLGFKL